MRSNCRCSCVLQFTRLHAVSCVLHRPTSRVIHHSRFLFRLFVFRLLLVFQNFCLLHVCVYCLVTKFFQTVLPHPAKGKEDSLRVFASLQPFFHQVQPAQRNHTSSAEAELGEPCFLVFVSVMILPQVHLRKPCYDFYFL